MDAQLTHIFLLELQRQARFGLMAGHDLNQALAALDLDRLWYSVQSLLVAAGNVSKLLWPSDPKIPDRAATLKQALNVPDDSPLEPRTFRNHFEHFDERLETWATSSDHRNVVDSNVGPPGAIVGIDPGDFLRNFDPTSGAITFRGDTYDIQPIAQALTEVYDTATQEIARRRLDPGGLSTT